MSFTLQAVPFAAVSAGLVALAVVSAVLRGDPIVRLGFVLIAVAALPWATAQAIAGAGADLDLALRVHRIGYAPLPLIGAGQLMTILAVVGKLDAHRPVVVGAIALALAATLLALATDLVVADVQVVAGALPFPVAGPVYALHLGLFALLVLYGVSVSRRTMLAHRRGERRQPRLGAALGLLAVVSVHDGLLAHRVLDGYPLVWLPALGAIVMALWGILRRDLLRAQGVDRPVAREVVTTAVVGVLLIVLAVVVPAPVRGTALVLVGAIAAGAVVIIGRSASTDVESPAQATQAALDRFVDKVASAATADEVARDLAALIEAQGLASEVQVWTRLEAGWWLVHGPQTGPAAAIAEPVESWLRRRGPFAIADLATERLDERRAAIDAWTRTLPALDVIVPLADRDALVGLCAGARATTLRDGDRVVLEDAARAAARALTVLSLTREVERRADLARELELAEAVRLARAVGDVSDLAGNRVAVIYQPAARVAGDVWSCAALPDGRLLVLVGDVAGRGLPSALVSAAIHGASQVAAGLLGARATPAAVLEQLHETVTEVDGGRHRVTAMAMIVDRAGQQVAWASAGHRGGYLLNPTGDGIALHALIARGTALGEPERVIGKGERALGPGDIIVLTSDGVVEARAPDGSSFGERRLQRALRNLGVRAVDRLAPALIEAVHGHVGEAPHDDDMLVVVIADPAG